MRSRTRALGLALGLLALAPTASADGWEIGPRLALSIPTRNAELSLDPGIEIGLTGTHMGDRTLGVDIRTDPSTKLGIDTSFHFLDWRDEAGGAFTAFTIGVSLLR